MKEQLLQDVLKIANDASEKILSIYNSKNETSIELKQDKSPVTEADLASDDIITKGLSYLTPNIPVISEESKQAVYAVRKDWDKFWLIDPLDGTKEFIKKTGDFSINIALIENHIPVLGVVVIPTDNTAYFALRNKYAKKQKGNNTPEKISVSSGLDSKTRVIISRRHGDSLRLEKFLTQLGDYDLILRGSTMKICLIAEGKADIYPRFGITSEWDTAAGQCILEAAGGKIIDLQGRDLRYNTEKSLNNPEFIALSHYEIIKNIDLSKI